MTVGFSSTSVPQRWRLVYLLNPLAGVIEGFRWALFGGSNRAEPVAIVLSVVIALLLLVGGAVYFRNTESAFADII